MGTRSSREPGDDRRNRRGPHNDHLSVVTSVGDLTVVESASAHDEDDRISDLSTFDQIPAPHSGVRERWRSIALWLAISDALCLATALAGAWFVFFGLRAMTMGYVLVLLTAPILWVGVFHGFGLYAPQHLAPWVEFRRVVGATTLGILLVMLAAFWSEASLMRGWVAVTWAVALVLEMVVRYRWRAHERRLKSDGRLAYRTLIVGTNSEAAKLATSLKAPGTGFDPLGYISVSDPPASPNGLKVLGRIDALEEVIRTHAVDCLFVASTCVGTEGSARVAQAARLEGVEVRVSANLPEILSSRLSVQQVGGVMALTLKPAKLSGAQAAAKRAFDLVVASLIGLASLPVCVLVAVAIRLTSRGPVLFRQQRVTKGGRSFTMYKFRTMVHDPRTANPSALSFKVPNDPRLTRVGGWLRRLSLDELPQLINVIRGDMSLVGPRPMIVEQVAANLELLRSRHEVPAGVTGWWQINGRSDVTPEQGVRLDLFYIENWSLTLDLYVVLKTIWVIVSRRGAY